MKKSIEVWIYVEATAEFLLLHVKNSEYDFWQPITGGVEMTESYPLAAHREVFEETGISLRLEKLVFLGEQVIEISKELTLAKEAFLVCLPQKPKIFISNEHIGYAWQLAQRVSRNLFWPNNQETFQWALDKIT